jgi:hypothetical protein
VPRPHQVAADVLARADEVAQRLLLDARHPDRVQPADHQQPQQALGVAPIGLDPIARRPRDLSRRRDETPDAGRLERPRKPEARRPGLIGHPRRARKPGAELHHRARVARQPAHDQFAALAVHRRGEHLRRAHVEPGPTANLCYVGTPMIAVGAQATPGPPTRAPHARVPTLTSTPDEWPTDRHIGLAAPSDDDPDGMFRDDPIIPYDLRHTFGSLAVRTAALSDVQAWMGHQHISTTMRYVHYVPQHDAAAKLTAVFTAGSVPRDMPRTAGIRA